jgi:Holliday junction DNA helicase RuvA
MKYKNVCQNLAKSNEKWIASCLAMTEKYSHSCGGRNPKYNIKKVGKTMITYVRGELVAEELDRIIVDVGGMGYQIFMSGESMTHLPSVGHEVTIHTYLNVKEDAMKLFGFLTREHLEIFKLLIGVNGVGPKGGLAILSVLSPDNLRYAVLSNDVKAISSAQGVGKKSAEKIILELRDKLKIEDMLESVASGSGTSDVAGLATGNKKVQAEVIQALEALGYGSTEALKAVKQVEIDETSTAESVLKQALRHIL